MKTSKYDASLPYWLAINNAFGIGPSIASRLLAQLGSAESICKASVSELKALGIPSVAVNDLQEPDRRLIERQIAWAEPRNREILTWDHPQYPQLLKMIYDPPVLLFVQGKMDALKMPQIALVGSRNPTHHGRDIAFVWSQTLTKVGIRVVSGLAIGIDGASHRGALSIAGQTLAVLGSGLNHIYPRSHLSLAEEIVEKGALISEFSPDVLPLAHHFPRRNRIISGLSLGVCVVEAALASGSLITAKMAAEQGREVFAVPGSIQSPLSQGCHALIQQGAKLVMCVADILNEIQHVPAVYSIIEEQTRPSLLDSASRQLLECVGYEMTTVDQLIDRSHKRVDQIIGEMTSLELQGLVYAVPGGYLRR